MAENLQIYDTDFYNVQGFKVVDENQNILTFEKVNNGDFFDYTKPVGAIYSEASSINFGLRNHTGITSINLPNATYVPNNFAYGCTNLISFIAPQLTNSAQQILRGCSSLNTSVFLPKFTTSSSCFRESKITSAVIKGFGTSSSADFYLDTELISCDILQGATIASQNFQGCPKFNLLILRSSTLITLGNINVFTNTCFASGKAGGTIYIPETLYNHLGDGTEYDYQSATNWSILHGYGTVTWEKIEGSYYQTHYAEGTLIETEG